MPFTPSNPARPEPCHTHSNLIRRQSPRRRRELLLDITKGLKPPQHEPSTPIKILKHLTLGDLHPSVALRHCPTITTIRKATQPP